jgi:hypothetical protein
MKPTSDSRHTLVFDWKRPARRGLSIFTWLFIMLLGMTGFFFLFKVIYPQSQRFTPVPQQLFVLDPSSPSHQAVINRVQDQDYLIIPGNDDATREVHLEDHAPVFHPSFERHEFSLQDLPRTKINVFPARLLDPTSPVLPPPDLQGLKPARAPVVQSGPSPAITLGFSGDLSQRQLLGKPDLSALKISDPGAWRFQIGVDGQGRVAYALPVATGEEQSEVKPLLSLLSKLRFDALPDPAAEGSVAWGVVTLHWKTVP